MGQKTTKVSMYIIILEKANRKVQADSLTDFAGPEKVYSQGEKPPTKIRGKKEVWSRNIHKTDSISESLTG